MERAALAEALAPWRARSRVRPGRGRAYVAAQAPADFMTRFAVSVAGTGEVFLGNQAWGDTEQDEVDQLLDENTPTNGELGWLMIPTGGSSGGVRFARHDGDTIAAAVTGFTRHFGVPRVNAVGLLPLYHVSGLMAWMRCVLTGGEYLALDWRKIADGRYPGLAPKADGWMVSLVPTQLERLMQATEGVQWLRQFRIIFIGGAPAWGSLLDRAAGAGLPLSPGYGMTETAAMVAGLRPDEFLAGSRSNGTPLPHARIDFSLEGLISVSGPSVFRGYYPELTDDSTIETEDIGEIDAAGRLRVLGRRDGVIITGGEKVYPAEVESVLRASGEFADLMVMGLPDEKWGQQVVVAYPAGRQPDAARVDRSVSRELAPYKRPRLYVPVPNWPVAANGKLRRAEITRYVVEGARPRASQG